MLRTRWGTPCAPDPSGHYPDYFEDRNYSLSESYADACLEPSKDIDWPRSSSSHLIRRHKRCRVTEEFDALFPLPEETEDGN